MKKKWYKPVVKKIGLMRDLTMGGCCRRLETNINGPNTRRTLRTS